MDRRFLQLNKLFSIRVSAIFFALIVLLSIACRKDKEDTPDGTDPPPSHQPTPYILELPEHFSIIFGPTLPEDNPLTVEGIALGKKLFFEKKLSATNQISCASCHRPESAFNDPGKAVSTGINGLTGTRNAMPLFNLAWTPTFDSKFNWRGSAESLEDQALEPVTIHFEMGETWPNVVNKLQNDAMYPPMFEAAFGTNVIDSTLVVKAIAQFERTLISGDSRMDEYVKELLNLNPPGSSDLTAQELRGFNIYVSTAKGDCFHCHGNVNLRNPLWTDFEFRNNGLDLNPDSGLALVTKKASDVGKFKTPSLRNLVYTAPYMHDGRFQTLEEVVEFYSTGVQDGPLTDPLMADRGFVNPNLTTQEKADLVAFLKTITDTVFVNNPDFRP
ncbi:MAG: cytochrome-c peroxidase [Flavobacteriales bacterium]|nr:cytochrome-c peroxidase [Flavobacteriales bacterium]